MHSALKVAVLMGGPSGEHAVSLRSGQGVAEALRQRCFTVEPLVIPQQLTVAQAIQVAAEGLRRARPDVAFIALHGTFGEDGTIQQLCEELQVAYTGSDATASRLGMDKVASRRRFELAGLSVPRWRTIDLASGPTPAHCDGFSYPVVVKPACQGSSLGVSLVKSAEAFQDALAGASRYGSQVLIEEFVPGREVTVGILGEEPLPIVEIRPREPFFNYTAKYTIGFTDYVVPAPLDAAVTQAVQAAGATAHRALGCRHLSRADIILSQDERPVVLEVNTIPGFTPTSLLPKAAACAGLCYEDLCEALVMMALHDAAHPART